MKILFITPEVAPWAKVGGLADVTAALPGALRAAGCEVLVVTPLHRAVDRARAGLELKRETVTVRLGDREHRVRVFESHLAAGVPVLFIEHGEYFDRPGLYDDRGTPFADNAERFGFFSRAALELCRYLDTPPDVIHAHDWPTGLVPYYLRTALAADPLFTDLRSVFTIHNLAYQGLFDRAVLPALDIAPEHFNFEQLEFHGRLSLLKAGLAFADHLTTVSRRYAEEIQTAEQGEGLDGLLRHRAADLTGIANGIDLREWDPRRDPRLPAGYGPRDLGGKRKCKQELLRDFGLAAEPAAPLIGMISRLTEQKGVDLVAEAWPALRELGVNLVILGSGEPRYQSLLEGLAEQDPTRIGLRLAHDEALAHRLEAGADLFLMPSRYEPCGLNQLYSLRYGTVPVVRATGGLDDTVFDVDADPEAGTGFKFGPFTSAALVEAVTRAVRCYDDHGAWTRLVRRGMAADHSWSRSAECYLEVYRQVIAPA